MPDLPTGDVLSAAPTVTTVATLPDGMIDRASPVPFYFQLSSLLEEEIVAGRWKPGLRIPSENDLCARYGLSRTTVRQALARLEQEGLVSREKGRGTFVSDTRPRTWMIQSVDGFFGEELSRSGRTVTSRTLRLERAQLPIWACDTLGQPAGSWGTVLERVRSVDGLVFLYVVNCLPDFVSALVDGLQAGESLYRRLAHRGGVSVTGGHSSLEAIGAGPKLAKLLEVESGTSLAYIESLSWDELNRKVDCYRAWLRTDRMRVEFAVSTGGGSQARDG